MSVRLTPALRLWPSCESLCQVRMYQGSTLLHSFTVERPVVSLRFGFYGREDNSLVIVHGKGSSITIKMLRRTVSVCAPSF